MRRVSTTTKSGVTCSSMGIRGRRSRAICSVAPVAIFSAWTSTVAPSTPSTSMRPLALTIVTSPVLRQGVGMRPVSDDPGRRGPTGMPQPDRTHGGQRRPTPTAPQRDRPGPPQAVNHHGTPPVRTYARAGRSVQLHRDQLRDARLLHGDAVEAVGDLHGLAVVGDEDELRVAAACSRSISTNRPMLASSSGASISSSRQNGLGLYLNRPNISAMAVSAFSPPDSSCTLCSRLPGGCAMISMPLSSGSFSSSSVRPARPPPNSVLKISWKLRLMAANASAKRSRVVSSMRLIASLVWAMDVDQILALRRQERVARLELVELLDRHHVDRAEAIDLGAQRA